RSFHCVSAGTGGTLVRPPGVPTYLGTLQRGHRILRPRLPRDCPWHQHLPAPLGSSPLGPTSISPGDCISQELSPGACTSPALFFS
uniref:Uncharacterized protein n=1 Tax=Anas zonorhyncha TaxID=75864 RepID=A0A8B9VDB7_9AVES